MPALPPIAIVAVQADADFDAVTSYRVAHYRGVVPAPPPGIPRIGASEVAALVARKRAVLIDVAPAEGGVRQPDGSWRLAVEHRGIPGAAWFPEAGRGKIDPAIERWFLSGVRELANKRRADVIVFCLADCWMSWNAALRLKRAGVRSVRWFAEGADGWREIGRPLQTMTPYQEQQ